MLPEIRRATVADAATLSQLAALTFTQTFGHLYPADDLEAFLAENYAVDRQRVILAHAAYAVWLVEQGGKAVGHAAVGPCGLPHPDVGQGDGELKRLYLLAHMQNSGLGSRLCQVALDWLERNGPRTLWVGVWSRNHAAQRFYARQGFEHVGDYEFAVGRARDHEFILRRQPA